MSDQHPSCPDHFERMRYEKKLLAWVCADVNCDVIAKKTEPDVSDSSTVIKPTSLDIVEGDSEEESYTLIVRYGKTLIEIDVTDHTEMVINDPNGDTTLCLLVGTQK